MKYVFLLFDHRCAQTDLPTVRGLAMMMVMCVHVKHIGWQYINACEILQAQSGPFTRMVAKSKH